MDRTTSSERSARAERWRGGLWWLLTGCGLGFSFLAILSIGIFILPLVVGGTVVLTARRVRGAALLLTGMGLGTAPWTFGMWLSPQCQIMTGRVGPDGREVTRCLSHADPAAWPFAVSAALVLLGAILFGASVRRAPRAPERGPRDAGGTVGPGYWVLVAALVGFGIIDLIAIGLPFLVLGLMLAALAPFRRRPEAFWPPLVGMLFLFVGFILVVPLSCTASAVARAGGDPARAGHTVCASLLGRDYSGGPGYQPPYLPAILAGIGAAAAAGVSARMLIRRHRRLHPAPA